MNQFQQRQDSLIRQLQGIWKVPFPFGAGWGDRGAGFEAATYSRHGRVVMLQGLVTKSGGAPAAGNVIGTLPVDFRPTSTLIFEVSSGATDSRGRVNVASSGAVTWEAGSATETDYTSLSGITFVVD